MDKYCDLYCLLCKSFRKNVTENSLHVFVGMAPLDVSEDDYFILFTER